MILFLELSLEAWNFSVGFWILFQVSEPEAWILGLGFWVLVFPVPCTLFFAPLLTFWQLPFISATLQPF
jgi:hypothetical protein